MSEDKSSFEIQDAATASTALGELVRAAGDSKEAKEAGTEIGKSAVTLAKALNNCLMPLAAMNYAFDRARTYFQTKFQDDLSEATVRIPADKFVEPKLSLAGPALQGIAFTHEEPPLKKMYLELIASAMDKRHADDAHPAFVEIIRQLTALEAGELKKIFQADVQPIIQLRERYEGGGARILFTHLLNWKDDEGKPLKDPRVPSMVVNWIRLGLVEVAYDRRIAAEKAYEWVESCPELLELREGNTKDGISVQPEQGVMSVTPFGKQFAIATGLVEPVAHRPETESPPPPATR